MARRTSAATKRTKVKDIPKSQRVLTGKDLRKVKGGATRLSPKLGDIKGESTDKDHKD